MLQKKKLVYSWERQIPQAAAVWQSTTHQSTRVIPNCKLFLYMAWEKREVTKNEIYNALSIYVKKTDHKPVKADISLRIVNYSLQCKSLSDWEGAHDCLFTFYRPADWTANTFYEFTCEITWFLPDTYSAPAPSNLHNEIGPFLMNSCLSDVTIVIGEEELPTHKLILGACSPVILAMLTSAMKEAAENRIVIKNIEIDVMKAILKFLYTGVDSEFDESGMALKGLAASEQYQMKKLKEICQYKLYKQLNIDNVIQILDDADRYGAETLKVKCVQFIINGIKEIINCENFQQLCLTKPELIFQFMHKLLEDRSFLE